ncbi:small subunit ribosomal protein S11 [Lewinella marina]|uniref:Small ribosomal subunit protein uS11 n=1 Tax=Neolewinella marina TaxID=438751 RepID=A0A2G0CGU3_9BACT|nr:30S ribosomal protein S11 [Neolewinella marina]NJB86353.1 small subunit ribosomal protein S11 [Neolewinella marina]PHK99178.1 30S ribosomal protein S11 [Neolewinella marina]
MAKRQASSRVAKKRKVKVDNEGLAYIQATFNNIIISITNKQGDVISWGSAGKEKFRGSKKSTPYAAQVASGNAARVAYEAGLRVVEVYVKGPGSGREAAIRAIDGAGIRVSKIKDVTPMPHNGCRPPKRRRV